MTASKMSGKNKKINLEVLGLSWNLTDFLCFIVEYIYIYFFSPPVFGFLSMVNFAVSLGVKFKKVSEEK